MEQFYFFVRPVIPKRCRRALSWVRFRTSGWSCPHCGERNQVSSRSLRPGEEIGGRGRGNCHFHHDRDTHRRLGWPVLRETSPAKHSRSSSPASAVLQWSRPVRVGSIGLGGLERSLRALSLSTELFHQVSECYGIMCCGHSKRGRTYIPVLLW